MAKIEIELSDELEARLNEVANRMALSPLETAKIILAEKLVKERSIDWIGLLNKALAKIMPEAKKES